MFAHANGRPRFICLLMYDLVSRPAVRMHICCMYLQLYFKEILVRAECVCQRANDVAFILALFSLSSSHMSHQSSRHFRQFQHLWFFSTQKKIKNHPPL